MSENRQWKENKNTIDSKDAEIIEKYGANIRKNFMDITNILKILF